MSKAEHMEKWRERNKLNNNPNNLVVLPASEHESFHKKGVQYVSAISLS